MDQEHCQEANPISQHEVSCLVGTNEYAHAQPYKGYTGS